MRLELIALAGLLLLCSLTQTSPAAAYCTADGGGPVENWAAQPAIPVFIDKGLWPRLTRSDGSSWTFSQIVREVHWATTHISTTSASSLPHFYYAGVSKDCGGTDESEKANPCQIPNAINLTYGQRGASASSSAHVPASDGMVISFNDTHDFDTGTAPGRLYFLGSLIHELMHTLGFTHPIEVCGQICDTFPCAAISGNNGVTNEMQHLYVDDVRGLRFVYGSWDRTEEDHHEDFDHNVGGSWWDVPVTIPAVAPPFEASGAPSGVDMLIGGRDPATLSPLIYHWDWPSLAWTQWGAEFMGDPHVGRVGAAWNHDDGWGIIGYQTGERIRDVTKTLNRLLLTRPTTFGTRTMASTTRRPGVSAAYHQGLSVFATRANNGQIYVHWLDAAANYSGEQPVFEDEGAGLAVFGYGTPSVACVDDPGILDVHCILVWAALDLVHTLRWMQFRIVFAPGGNLEVDEGMIRSDSLMMDSPPHVTYRGPSSGPSAWILAFTQKVGIQHYAYTLQKQLSESADWDPASWRMHGPYDAQVASTIGSANFDGELLVSQ